MTRERRRLWREENAGRPGSLLRSSGALRLGHPLYPCSRRIRGAPTRGVRSRCRQRVTHSLRAVALPELKARAGDVAQPSLYLCAVWALMIDLTSAHAVVLEMCEQPTL